MIETLIGLGFAGMFIACFISGTIFPFSSDVIVAALIVAGLDYQVGLLVATLGGWLGSLVNYYLGRLGKTEWIEKYSNIRREKIVKIEHWLNGRGAYMALFAWFPVVGSVITLALGYLRANVWVVGMCLLVGMFMRYGVVVYLTLKGVQLVY